MFVWRSSHCQHDAAAYLRSPLGSWLMPPQARAAGRLSAPLAKRSHQESADRGGMCHEVCLYTYIRVCRRGMDALVGRNGGEEGEHNARNDVRIGGCRFATPGLKKRYIEKIKSLTSTDPIPHPPSHITHQHSPLPSNHTYTTPLPPCGGGGEADDDRKLSLLREHNNT